MRRALLTAIAVMLVGLLASCLWSLRPQNVTAADVVGGWRGAGDVQIQILPDNRLRGSQVPFQLNGGVVHEAWTGTAHWRLVPHDDYQGPHLEVGLDAEEAATNLYIGSHNGTIALFIWIGDPDEGNRYWFRKTG